MIAKVIVDIASSLVDKVFDYSFEPEMNLQRGMRVLVPFGAREIEGYVIDVASSTDVDPKRLKSVSSKLESFKVINDDQLELAQFMKEKYNIGLCDCLRLFLPAEMRNGKVKELEETWLYIDPDQATDYLAKIKKNAHAQLDVLTFMLNEGSYKQAELNKKFSPSAINKLKESDILKTRYKVVRRRPYSSTIEKKDVNLTDLQQHAVKTIFGKNNRFLIHGVTGSGKTEVYMAAIKQVVEKGQTAIMLVPEISLTPQVLANFRAKFGDEVALLHSALSAGERFDEWKRILMGDAKIVVGARSAIFAPLKNIGLIVIDEEHDGSYISESNPRFNTIEVATKRAELCGGKLVLGSATPSIETYHGAMTGKYELIEMGERINKKPLPPISIVDMTRELREGNPDIFSRQLKDAMQKALDSKEQIMLFINRRGYSSFLMCRNCGWVAKCDNCDVTLVYHKAENALKCHYCANRYKVFDVCPECKSDDIKQGSLGTERVVSEIKNLFPKARVLRMDNDTTKTKGAHEKLLTAFRKHEADILVGTQMIAKGHDFPDVTLVGIIDADVSLHQSTYKASERTFNLITQVAGRAGRADKSGQIILQTYAPRNYIYRLASKYDYAGFYRKEINLREVTKFPPFSTIVRILVTSSSEELAKDKTKEYYNAVKQLMADGKAFHYLGVMKSPVGRIQNKFRYQILMRLKTETKDEIISQIYKLVDGSRNKDVQVFVEIDPSSLS